jgi:hypothetical protein
MAAGDSLTGVDGSCSVPNDWGVPQETTNIHIFAWEGVLDREVVDDSNFDDTTNWKSKLGGMYHMTGTFTGTVVKGSDLGIADFGTKNQQPKASLVLTVESGGTYTCTAILSNLNTRVNKIETRGAIITGSFESDGDVTVA